MNQISLLAVLLSCFMMCTATKLAQCNLKGQWMNNLGSNMTISDVSNDGKLTGTYLTAVSTTNKTIVKSPLIGYQQLNDSPTFGFTVQWQFTGKVIFF
ncbi:Avidin-like, partial [Pristimantis euphronides]